MTFIEIYLIGCCILCVASIIMAKIVDGYVTVGDILAILICSVTPIVNIFFLLHMGVETIKQIKAKQKFLKFLDIKVL